MTTDQSVVATSVEEKSLYVPQFPDVMKRVTKVFGSKRVSWCIGEDLEAWRDPLRHWLEIDLGDHVVRDGPSLYGHPTFLCNDGQTFVAFTEYFDGCGMPVEQPLLASTGENTSE